MFSGQGSQYFRMGQALYEQRPVFRHWMQRLDRIFTRAAGQSLLGTLYGQGRAKSETFDELSLTHPALFAVGFATAQTLIDGGVEPDIVLGTSVGAFIACALAGCLDVETAFAAVVGQAQAVQAHCEEGAMIAVLADPKLFEEANLSTFADLAALNFAGHFVIATSAAHVSRLEQTLRQRGLTFQRLSVRFAFHSRWIEPAGAPCTALLRSLATRAADTPIACCAGAQLLDAIPADYLWSVVRRPIRFRETIQRLESGGAVRYIDAGPAGTLATFAKYALPPGSRSQLHWILSPFGGELARLDSLALRSPA